MSFLKSTRGKIIIVAGVLLIAAAAVLSVILTSTQKGYRSISVTEIAGTVTVSANGKEYDAYENMHVSDGYSLTTLIASYIRLALDNDKYVKLDEESKAVFTKVGNAKSKKTQIELEYGTLTTEITKPLLKDESYVVNTPNSVLAVRGTMYKLVVVRDENGVEYTDVYTYGGTVAVKRIKPDGTVVEEDVLVKAGYKTRIRMDTEETVYIEEYEEEFGDNVDPIDPSEISDEDIVLMYDAAKNGHDMFMSTDELEEEIAKRDIDLDDYHSVYDGGKIPPLSGSNSADNENGAVTVPPASNSANSVETTAVTTVTTAETEVTTVTTVPEETISETVTETAVSETSVTETETEVTTDTSVETTAETTTTVPSETTEETTTTKKWPSPSGSHAADTVTTTAPTAETTTAVTECTHDWKKVSDGMAASCEEDGIAAVYKCSKCGEVSGGETIPALGHDWVEDADNSVAAGCVTDGVKAYKCSRCSDVKTESIAATEHDMQFDSTTATCGADGITIYKCSKCGLESVEETPATGKHRYRTETSGSMYLMMCWDCDYWDEFGINDHEFRDNDGDGYCDRCYGRPNDNNHRNYW